MPLRTKFSTKGIAETLEALAQQGHDVDQSVDRSLAAGGQVYLDGMQRRVAILTGNLHDKLSMDGPNQDGNYHYLWVGLNHGVDAETARYGAVNEYGSSSMDAQPYIRPTIHEDSPRARRAFLKSLKTDLRGEA